MNESEAVYLSQDVKYNTSRTYLSKIVVFAIVFIVVISIYMNGSTNQISYSYKKLNNTFFPTHISLSQQKFDVVLNYYNEDVAYVARFIQYLRNVTTLQKRQLRIIVYNKNSKMNGSHLKKVLKADIIQSLPNLGREGGTYLYHIITNYYSLAHHILFCQAGVEGITDTGLTDWFSHRLEQQFNSSLGYMPLVDNAWITTFDCGVRQSQNMPRLPELWALIELTICPPDGQGVAFRGQFLVSSKRIVNRPLRIYQYLFDLITANNSHWIHRDKRSPPTDSTADKPIFGHVVERTWTVLFGCAPPDLLQRCERNQCGCYD